jgi:hypothetical protein
LSGAPDLPTWELPGVSTYDADPATATRERFAEARQSFLERTPNG